MLMGALGSGEAEHRPRSVEFCSIPETLPHYIVPLTSAQTLRGTFLVLHAFYGTWFCSVIIPSLDLRLKSTRFPPNDRQNDTVQQVIVLLSHPSGTTGKVLSHASFDMYSGGKWAPLLAMRSRVG